jgi:Major intrinsic protein
MDMPRRLGAEFFGTFWLTFAGCGSAVLAAGFPSLGIGFLGVSFAFGLTVLTMAYAVGHISGGHFNCAVTIGLWAGGRFKAGDVLPYIAAQDRRHRGGGGPLCHRLRQARLGARRVRLQWLWRSQPRQVRLGIMLPDRSHRDLLLFSFIAQSSG